MTSSSPDRNTLHGETPVDSTVWVFTALENVNLPGLEEVKLTESLSLVRPNQLLLSCRDRHALSGEQYQRLENISCFLLLREQAPPFRGPERDKRVSKLQNALMAFQVVKPLLTSGLLFQAIQLQATTLNLERIQARPPMDPGIWAKMRSFDTPLLSQIPDMISRVQSVMEGSDSRKKNAIYLFQLALEQVHPYITALLAVAGMEAIFDSSDRNIFKQKLCNCLGASTPAFPDWNSPEKLPPSYTAEELAVHLYTLRSKIAHGANLLDAVKDKSAPVNLLELVDLLTDFDKPTYAMVLCESSIYLLAEVLKKVL